MNSQPTTDPAQPKVHFQFYRLLDGKRESQHMGNDQDADSYLVDGYRDTREEAEAIVTALLAGQTSGNPRITYHATIDGEGYTPAYVPQERDVVTVPGDGYPDSVYGPLPGAWSVVKVEDGEYVLLHQGITGEAWRPVHAVRPVGGQRCPGSGTRLGVGGTPGSMQQRRCPECERLQLVALDANGAFNMPEHQARQAMADGQEHVVGDRISGSCVTNNTEYTGMVAEVIPPLPRSGQYGPRYRLVETGVSYAGGRPVEPIVQV